MKLTTRLHDRDAAGMTYVYPVVSRRARGVSVGINLNPNNACNWRCVYCQVPDLTAGKGPPIDLEQLRRELRAMLTAILQGDYLERHVPKGFRRLNDVAFSGNGEPTSSPDFEAAIEVTEEVLQELGQRGSLRIILISNGSLVHLEPVQRGLERLGAMGGEIWFKIDSATAQGQKAMNSIVTGPERTAKNLQAAASRCPTWVQTMLLARRGQEPSDAERDAYVRLLDSARPGAPELRGVLLYGLARASHQPEAPELTPASPQLFERWAEDIRALGLDVSTHP